MNQENSRGHKVLALIFAAITVVTVVAVRQAGKKSEKEVKNLSVISSESDFQTALKGSPQTYVIENAVLSGEPVNDPFGIFSKEMLSITSKKEKCKQKTVKTKSSNGKTKTKLKKSWSTVSNDVNNTVSDKVCIYGNTSISLSTFNIKGYPKSLSSYCGNCCVKDDYYYPSGSSSKKMNNERYRIEIVPNDSKISCIAVVGDNIVTTKGKSITKNAVLVINGNRKALIKAYTNNYKTVSTVVIAVGAVLTLIMLFSKPRQRNNY